MAKRKRKPRRLWVKIRGKAGPGTTRAEFLGTLRKAVKGGGEYELPDDYTVTIEWKNKADAPWKSDGFASAMTESAESSRGWDKAILRYIDRQLSKTPDAKSAAGRVAARTRERTFNRRSAAARKGWRTRRREFSRRSRAARLGWARRRGSR